MQAARGRQDVQWSHLRPPCRLQDAKLAELRGGQGAGAEAAKQRAAAAEAALQEERERREDSDFALDEAVERLRAAEARVNGVRKVYHSSTLGCTLASKHTADRPPSLQAKQRTAEQEEQLQAAQEAAAEQQQQAEAEAAAAVERFQAQCEEVKAAATTAGHEAGV